MHDFDEGHSRTAMHCILDRFVKVPYFSIFSFNDWITNSSTGVVYRHLRLAEITINPHHKRKIYFYLLRDLSWAKYN